MCRFLIGTVLTITATSAFLSYVDKQCRFLIGTVLTSEQSQCWKRKRTMKCRFLIGTVLTTVLSTVVATTDSRRRVFSPIIMPKSLSTYYIGQMPPRPYIPTVCAVFGLLRYRRLRGRRTFCPGNGHFCAEIFVSGIRCIP